jgi:hypothetical protein
VRVTRLTPEEIAERENDPSALTRFAFRHPWVTGLFAAALIVTWGLVLGIAWPIPLSVGIALMLLVGLVWRPTGPGQRWRRYTLRRFPKKQSRRS